ncbi:MAG: CTP synthase [Lasallia pustulata]|uniref:CTP synthase n=1 Tax=Lasallia pustulata TaxID=136370 RepID=A0A5M8PGM8_9LECA|nr:MAG: CTP synthase [Lasallia pustulata]
MAPTEPGEVFVFNDGRDVDLDLGNYKRYLKITLTRENNITTGKIYQHVIERERRGDYLSRTVQVVPHLTDAIQDWIERVARILMDDTNEDPDICIIELGGTVRGIKSGPFVEAIEEESWQGQFSANTCLIDPCGLSPDLIACRCFQPLEKSTTDKISMFCQVEPNQVVAVHDVTSTYHVPMLLEQQGLIVSLQDILRLHVLTISPALSKKGAQMWQPWKTLMSNQNHLYQSASIALVGKYTNLHDSYLCVIKSLEHAAVACAGKLNLIWVDASHLEIATSQSSPADYHKAWHEVCTAQGILVPGGFSHRGTEGMIAAAQ